MSSKTEFNYLDNYVTYEKPLISWIIIQFRVHWFSHRFVNEGPCLTDMNATNWWL
jgi:hypothetical protein